NDARAAFPTIPGVHFPEFVNELELLGFGPGFKPAGGILAPPVPKIGPRYAVYVPKSNEDGLNVGGVRPLEIRAPIGTHTGWNVRAKEFRGPNMCPLTGSFIPFARTKEQ